MAVDRRLGAPLGSVLLVACVTGAIELLKGHVPVLSLGVLYLLAVLPTAVLWGLAHAVAVSVLSMLAFNFFFLPPLYTLTLSDSRNWFALGIFLLTAVVVSELAARSRRRALESALLAEIAASLLEGGDVSGEFERIAEKAAPLLHVERARIELGDGAQAPMFAVEGAQRTGAAARRRLVPALASLLGVAIDRERLSREALEAEALRQSDSMKTAVLRAVSHDLRTPLMAILTSASALARPDLELDPSDRDELVETILGEAGRLDRLVGNLLDLSRLQAGAAQTERELWAIDDLVVQALDELGEAAARVDVAFPEESPAVRVDAHQIQRVLVNLIENALKHSPPAERVRLQVAATRSEVTVRVIDHGPGVAAADLERVFEPFYRGPGSAAAGGAGLGLAIARGFAEANDGRVWLESRLGQGATFVLVLPAPGESLAT